MAAAAAAAAALKGEAAVAQLALRQPTPGESKGAVTRPLHRMVVRGGRGPPPPLQPPPLPAKRVTKLQPLWGGPLKC